MPCNSDYMEATASEKNNAKVLALLEELKTGKLPEWYGDGYDKRVYNITTKEVLDKNVSNLCKKLQKIEDTSKYSLEMQMWWRDHQTADAKRVEKELLEKKDRQAKKELLAKLTPYEKKLLNL